MSDVQSTVTTNIMAQPVVNPDGTNVGGSAAISAVIPGTGATNLGKAEDAAHTTADVGVMLLAVRKATAADLSAGNTDGDYEPLEVDANGRLHVIASSGVAGDIASAASDSGNPLKIGAVGHTAAPTAVTDGQRVNLIADKVGKLIAVGAIRDLKGVTQTQISSSTSETTIVAAGGASVFVDLYGLILANTGATTTKVVVKDDTAGTTRAIIEVPTLETRGFTFPVDSAIPQAVANKPWTATCASSTAALEVTAMWVKNI